MKKWSFDVSKDDTLAVKGIAIMMMLVHHLFAFPARLLPGTHFNSLFVFADSTTLEWHVSAFCKVCVAIFTLLAGYGIFKSYSSKLLPGDEQCESLLAFFARRLKRLYFKVWPVFIVFVPLGLILGKPNVNTYVSQWIRNALLLETNFNFEWWFLTEYVILIFMTPMVMWFFRRKRSNIYNDMVWIILLNVFVTRILAGFVVKFPYAAELNVSYFWIKMSIALSLLPIYMTGAWLAKYDVFERVINSLRTSVVKRVLVAVALLLVAYFLRDGWRQQDRWGIDFFDFAYASMVTLGIVLLVYRARVVKSVLVVFGKQSIGIWLTHSFFCYYYFQELVYAPKNPILIFLLALGFSFMSAWILDTGVNGLARLAGHAPEKVVLIREEPRRNRFFRNRGRRGNGRRPPRDAK